MSVLIITMPCDIHAQAVYWAIKKLGGTCDILYPLDLAGGANWSWTVSGDELVTEFRGNRSVYNLSGYETVWLRRPPGIIPLEHLDDDVERAISEAEFNLLTQSIYRTVEVNAFAVNPVGSTRTASLKPYQFNQASLCGLPVPRTLVSNSREEILGFFEELDCNIVYKPVKAGMWPIGPEEKTRAPWVPTTRMTRELLLKADLASAPGIYQECIAKASEVRATVMGRSVFAWEKTFAGRKDVDVDWRYVHKEANVALHKLPDGLSQKCFDLMDRLDLRFGCFDFAIDADGQYHFLEVNPQGQWIWGDEYGVGLNQLDAMAQYLMTRDRSFSYDPSGIVSLEMLNQENGLQAFADEEELHHGTWMTHLFHQRSLRANPVHAFSV